VLDEEGVQIALEYTGLLESDVASQIIENLGRPVTVTKPDPQPLASEEGEQVANVEERQVYQIEKVPHFTRSRLLLANLVRILTDRRRGLLHNSSVPAPSLPILSYSQSAHFDTEGSRADAPRPTSHPELSVATDMTSMMYSQSARMLPPIKIPTQSTVHKQQSRPRKRLLDATGFDEAYTRETPRMLHYDNSEQHDPVKQVEALRRELQIAKAGVNQLNRLVDKNIAWVQQNCDMSQYAGQFSERAKRKCQRMAADRIGNVYASLVGKTLQWAVHRWREALRFEHCRKVALQYCKAKSIVGITKVLLRWHLRCIYSRWVRWIYHVKAQIRVEREAATVQIQRIIRGFLGRRRARNKRLGKSAVHIQCLFRKIHAGHVVSRKKLDKQLKISNAAAVRIQKLINDFVAIKRAKAELARRKAKLAATKIQKIARGQKGRERFKLKQEEIKRQAEEREREEARRKAEAEAEALVAADALKEAGKRATGTDLDALASQASSTAPLQVQSMSSSLAEDQADAISVTSHGGKSSSNYPTKSKAPKTKIAEKLTPNKDGAYRKVVTKTLTKSIEKPIDKPVESKTTYCKPVEITDDAAIKIQKITRGKIARRMSNHKANEVIDRAAISANIASSKADISSAVDGDVPVHQAIVDESPQEAVEDEGTVVCNNGDTITAKVNEVSEPVQIADDKLVIETEDIISDNVQDNAVNQHPREQVLDTSPVRPHSAPNHQSKFGNNDGVSGLPDHSPLSARNDTTPVSTGAGKSASPSPSRPVSGSFMGALSSPIASASGFIKNAFGSFSNIRRSGDASSPATSSLPLQNETKVPRSASRPTSAVQSEVQNELPPVVEMNDSATETAADDAAANALPLASQDYDTTQFSEQVSLEAIASNIVDFNSSDGMQGQQQVLQDITEQDTDGQMQTPADNEEAFGVDDAGGEQENEADGLNYDHDRDADEKEDFPPQPEVVSSDLSGKQSKKTAAQRSAESKKKLEQDRIARRSKELEDKKKAAKDSAQSKQPKSQAKGKGSGNNRKVVKSEEDSKKEEMAKPPILPSGDNKESSRDGGNDGLVTSSGEARSNTMLPVVVQGNCENLAEQVHEFVEPNSVKTMRAATRIQLLIRAMIARRRFRKRKEEVAKAQQDAEQVVDWATVTIQKSMRGKIGRKRYETVRKARHDEVQRKSHESASKIQARLRGMQDRKRVEQIKRSRTAEKKHVDWLKSYQKQSIIHANSTLIEEHDEDEGSPGHVVEESEKVKRELLDLPLRPSSAERPTRESLSRPLSREESKITEPVTSNSPTKRSSLSEQPVIMPSLSRPSSRQKLKTPEASINPKSNRSNEPGKDAIHHAKKSPHYATHHGHPRPPITDAPHQESQATPQPPPESAGHPVQVVTDPRLDTLDEKLKMLEEVERRIKASEENLALGAKMAEERIQQQMAALEAQAKKAEADRKAQEELMKLAVGSMSHRSPYATGGPYSSRRGMMSTRGSAPPTARSARAGNIPTDAPKLIYQGQEWLQLWDDEQQAYYWWCPATQAAQWEQPGMEQYYQQQYYAGPAATTPSKSEGGDESGYESSGGALTDYSTDHDMSYYTDTESVHEDWQEYWDEQAQAKYWYNNTTVGAAKSFSFIFYVSNDRQLMFVCRAKRHGRNLRSWSRGQALEHPMQSLGTMQLCQRQQIQIMVGCHT
ncbi:hypothetical protein EON65_11795, partial [archaeon]